METKTKEKCKKIQKSEMKYNIKFRPNKYDLLSKDIVLMDMNFILIRMIMS